MSDFAFHCTAIAISLPCFAFVAYLFYQAYRAWKDIR